MSISDLRDAIRDAWNFAYPPTRNVLFLGLAIWFVAPSWFHDLFVDAGTRIPIPSDDKALVVVLDSYGLKPLIPFIGLIVVMSILYLVNKCFVVIGHVLPGWISYSTGVLYARFPHNEVLEVWAHYPRVKRLDEMTTIIRSSSESSRKSGEAGATDVSHWMEKGAEAFSLQLALKVILLAILMLPLVTQLPNRRRWIEALVGLTVLLGVVFARMIYCFEQEEHARFRLVRLALGDEKNNTNNKLEADDPRIEDRRKELRDIEHYGIQWWRIRFANAFYLPWAIRSIINPKRRQLRTWYRALRNQNERDQRRELRTLVIGTDLGSAWLAWKEGSRDEN